MCEWSAGHACPGQYDHIQGHEHCLTTGKVVPYIENVAQTRCNSRDPDLKWQFVGKSS